MCACGRRDQPSDESMSSRCLLWRECWGSPCARARSVCTCNWCQLGGQRAMGDDGFGARRDSHTPIDPPQHRPNKPVDRISGSSDGVFWSEFCSAPQMSCTSCWPRKHGRRESPSKFEARMAPTIALIRRFSGFGGPLRLGGVLAKPCAILTARCRILVLSKGWRGQIQCKPSWDRVYFTCYFAKPPCLDVL